MKLNFSVVKILKAVNIFIYWFD